MQKEIGRGYLRKRNDGIVEFIIGDAKSIKELIKNLLPYLKLKRKQARLMLEILEIKSKIKNAMDFLKLAKKIDVFEQINYSKKRIQNSLEVEKILRKQGLLAP